MTIFGEAYFNIKTEQMRVIDLHKQELKLHKVYNSLEMPMKIYYSRDSLLRDNRGKVINIIENITQWTNLCKKLTTRDNGYAEAEIDGIIYLNDYYMFLKTQDKFIPEDYDDEGNKKLTDKPMRQGGFIRLYAFQHQSVSDKLFTSSGIWNVTLNTYQNTSVALRPKGFYQHNIGGVASYETKLTRLLESNQPKVADLRLFNLLFNPYSFAYMDTDKALRIVYPHVRKEDRNKIMETERFRRLFMSEMTKMMPNLIEGIQATNSPADIGNFIKQMRDKAIESGTTDDQVKVLSVVLQAGYGSMVANPSTESNVPLVLDAHTHHVGDVKLIPSADEYRDNDIKPEPQDTKVEIVDEPSKDDEVDKILNTQMKEEEKDIVKLYEDDIEAEGGVIADERKEKLSEKEFKEQMEYHAVSDMYLED